MTKLFFTSAICIFQWFLCELLFCVWSWLTKFYFFFSRAGKRPYLTRPEFHCLNSDKLVLRCLMNFEKNFEKQFGIQVNENFESIHKLQVVKWNRLTLSSVFFFFIRNRSLDNACYREYTDAVEMLRRMWQKSRLCLGLLLCKMVLKCDLLMSFTKRVCVCVDTQTQTR